MAIEFITGYVMGSRAAGRAAGMAASAAQFSTNPSNRIYDLDERMDRLTLVIEAMWSLMAEQGLTEDQLRDRIIELDGQDGAVDGVAIRERAECPECEAKVNPGVAKCQFCGHEMGDASPFAAI